MRKYIFLAGTLALLLAGCGTSAPEQTGKRGGKPINKQVTFYLTEEQLEILKAVVRIQDIRKSMDCGEIVTYRFAVLGLLLNNEALNRKQTVIR